MAILDELLVSLGFEYDEKNAQNFQNDMRMVALALTGVATAATFTLFKLNQFVDSISHTVKAQDVFAESLGLNVQALDEWSLANELAGGSVHGFNGAIKAFSINMEHASRGMGSAREAIGRLGLNFLDSNGNVRETTELLHEVSDRLQNFKVVERYDIASQLGLEALIPLLNQGSANIELMRKRAAELGTVNERQIKVAREFQLVWKQFIRIWRNVRIELMAALVPFFKISGAVFQLWLNVKDFMHLHLAEYLGHIATLLKIIAALFLVLIPIVLLSKIAALIMGLGKLARAALFFNKWLWAVTALVLALEDVYSYLQGHDSILGRIINKVKEWGNSVANLPIIRQLLQIGTLLKFIYDGISTIKDDFIIAPIFNGLFKLVSLLLYINELKDGIVDWVLSGFGLADLFNIDLLDIFSFFDDLDKKLVSLNNELDLIIADWFGIKSLFNMIKNAFKDLYEWGMSWFSVDTLINAIKQGFKDLRDEVYSWFDFWPLNSSKEEEKNESRGWWDSVKQGVNSLFGKKKEPLIDTNQQYQTIANNITKTINTEEHHLVNDEWHEIKNNILNSTINEDFNTTTHDQFKNVAENIVNTINTDEWHEIKNSILNNVVTDNLTTTHDQFKNVAENIVNTINTDEYRTLTTDEKHNIVHNETVTEGMNVSSWLDKWFVQAFKNDFNEIKDFIINAFNVKSIFNYDALDNENDARFDFSGLMNLEKMGLQGFVGNTINNSQDSNVANATTNNESNVSNTFNVTVNANGNTGQELADEFKRSIQDASQALNTSVSQ